MLSVRRFHPGRAFEPVSASALGCTGQPLTTSPINRFSTCRPPQGVAVANCWETTAPPRGIGTAWIWPNGMNRTATTQESDMKNTRPRSDRGCPPEPFYVLVSKFETDGFSVPVRRCPFEATAGSPSPFYHNLSGRNSVTNSVTDQS